MRRRWRQPIWIVWLIIMQTSLPKQKNKSVVLHPPPPPGVLSVYYDVFLLFVFWSSLCISHDFLCFLGSYYCLILLCFVMFLFVSFFFLLFQLAAFDHYLHRGEEGSRLLQNCTIHRCMCVGLCLSIIFRILVSSPCLLVQFLLLSWFCLQNVVFIFLC